METAGRPHLLALTDNLHVCRRLRRLARENGLALAQSGAGPAPDEAGPEPAVAVVDLHRPDALDLVRGLRARWPDTLVAGFLTEPDRQRWVAAQRAGCDLVTNTGALVPRLRGHLSARAAAGGGRASRRFPLLEAADAAGRLGLVYRTDESPVGPLAVFQVAGGLHAVSDRCPHAGAVLSDGEVEAGVLTCPRHGSRFDVRTGERVRGPADTGLACHRLVQEGGQVFLVLPG